MVGMVGLVAGIGLWILAERWATARLVVSPGEANAGVQGGGAGDGRVQPLRSAFFVVFVGGCGLYAALAAARFGGDATELVTTLGLAACLTAVLLIDARTRLIPNVLLGIGAAAGLGVAALAGPYTFVRHAAAAVGAALVFGLLWKAASLVWQGSAEAPFGEGDVFLAGTIGAMVGLPEIAQALFLGAVLAGAASLAAVALRRVERHEVIPYGPFLCLGGLVTLLR